MSMWTHIIGVLYIDTCEVMEKEELKKFVEDKLANAPKITGSEENTSYYVNVLNGSNFSTSEIVSGAIVNKEYQTCVAITLIGDLRDREREFTEAELEMFIDYIKDAFAMVRDYSICIDDEKECVNMRFEGLIS